MPYRTVRVVDPELGPQTFWARVADDAIAEWLRERTRLRACGYPDRPPDVDAPNLRGWLPFDGEEALPYFRDRAAEAGPAISAFPVLCLVWANPLGLVAKIIVTGCGDGAFVSRVVIEDDSGGRSVDKVRLYGPDTDPSVVGEEIETVIRFIDWAPMGWGAKDPIVTDVSDFAAFDAELTVAEVDARAIGLLAPRPVN